MQIIDDQKREIQQLLRECEEAKARNGQLEDEVKEVQTMLHEQQRIYSTHINELRNQLNELEDATKGKFEEQLVSLQLELKLKQEQLSRALLDREQTEKKFKQKLEDMGMSTHNTNRLLNEKENERDELARVVK